MATIRLEIAAENINEVMETFDQIKVYRSTTGIDGTYSEITDALTRIDLVADQIIYDYTDTAGETTYYYRFSYFHSTNLTESAQSDPIAGEGIQGLYCTIQSIRDEGVPVSKITDDDLIDKISLASRVIEKITRQFFDPRTLSINLDGDGTSILRLNHPIIKITSMGIIIKRSPYTETTIPISELVIRNRHLVSGILSPDDRDTPAIEYQSDIDELHLLSAATWANLSGDAYMFPVGRQNIRVDGVFGWTEIGTNDTVGETEQGSQIPVSFGTTPLEIQKLCKLLVMNEIEPMWSGLAARNSRQNINRIKSEKTKTQSYTLDSLASSGTQGAWTGNPEIDSILARYISVEWASAV